LIVTDTPARRLSYETKNSTLYFTQENSIWKKALPGGASSQVTPTTDIAATVASDGSYVYWSEYSGTTKTSTVRRVPVAGGASSSLANGLSYLEQIVARDKTLYVLEDPFNGTGVKGNAHILAIPLPNGVANATAPVLADAGTQARAMAIDDSGVYWTEVDAEGSIRHCPLSGCVGAPEVLAGTEDPWAVTTDARAVYWTTAKGQVMKMAK
jgi:hypothetical protein